MKEVFEQNPDLEKVYATSDGECFYNENDAKNHAKKLEVKTVETVYNENLLEVIDEEELTDADKEMAEFEAAEKAKEEQAAQEAAAQKEAEEKAKEEQEAQEAAAKKEADDKAELAKSLDAFDPETVKYPEALKLFKALGLDAENVKAETIYPLLSAAKVSALQGIEPKNEN